MLRAGTARVEHYPVASCKLELGNETVWHGGGVRIMLGVAAPGLKIG